MVGFESLLKGACNTREIEGVANRGVFLRSGALAALTEEDVCTLKEKGITTLIDLRTEEEVSRRPCTLSDREEFSYHHLPIAEGSEPPACLENVPLSYMCIAEAENMAEVFRKLANACGGAVYFCTAGKDRTGVVSAILQLLAGVEDEVIIKDYTLSREYNKALLEAYLSAHPETDRQTVLANEVSMAGFLKLFREKYRSAESYLAVPGLSENEINKLRSKLINNEVL